MPTAQLYRRALANALDDLAGPYTITSATANTVVVPALINGAANVSPNGYAGRWVYVASGAGAGQTRRVRTNGYVAATGALTIDPAWTITPVNGDAIELTGYFPATPQVGADSSYLTLINAALRQIVAPDRISVPITTSQESPLVTWAGWLDREERLRAVWEPGPTGGLPVPADFRRPRLRLDADLPVLELAVPFASSSGLLALDVLRPADTWIKTAGAWGESAVGLVSETDEARPSVEDVKKIGKMAGYEALVSRSPGRPSGDFLKAYADARSEAMAVRYFDTTALKTPAPQPVAAAGTA
jgi:hypothetical protein